MKGKTPEQELLERTLRATLHYVWRKREHWMEPGRCPQWLQRDATAAAEDWEAFLADHTSDAERKNEEARIQVVLSGVASPNT